jgi:Trk K+ transport system NAD-binding subunit
VGRIVADALSAFDAGYHAVECDEQRLRAAIADGYDVSHGDGTDLRLWQSVDLHGRKVSVTTAPNFSEMHHTYGQARRDYPQITRLVYARNSSEASRLRTIGLLPVVDKGDVRGMSLAVAVLREVGYTGSEIKLWVSERSRSRPRFVSVEN